MSKKYLPSQQKPSTPLIFKIMHLAYLLLFFLTPLLISVKSTELFEFPKMLFVYLLTGIIAGLWMADAAISGKLTWKKSWVDLVFMIILLTQLISSLFSLDRYTSFFGYYSRFHGGFWSSFCYLLLAWIFKNYARKSWVKDIILSSLASASIVSIYGIAEHFGIDAQFWVQDVQNRVFSTLGQPNWLAAWLGALLPFAYLWYLKPPKSFWPTVITLNVISILISYGLTYAVSNNPLPLSGKDFVLFLIFYTTFNGLIMLKAQWLHEKLTLLKRFNFLLLIIMMQLAILFTKSRSGILALLISAGLFFLHELLTAKKVKILLPLIFSSLFLILLVGTEWTPSIARIMGRNNQVIKNPLTSGSSNPGVSDSADIRKVVWKGAVEIWKQKPLFGTGTETFAYSYYNVRTPEYNQNSEWDFLYNKAHNEYLNFLANNGILGTAAILTLIIGVIYFSLGGQVKSWLKAILIPGIIFVLIYLFNPNLINLIIHKLLIYPPLLLPLGIAVLTAVLIFYFSNKWNPQILSQSSKMEAAFLASIASIVITNFYGFSVVTVGLFFFFLPVCLTISQNQFELKQLQFASPNTSNNNGAIAWIGVGGGLFLTIFILIFTLNYYQADLAYNFSENYLKQSEVLQADKEITTALQLHPGNANYWLHKGLVSAQTAFLVDYKDASDSSGLVKHFTKQAVEYTQTALLKNQVHINLYKSAARVYITLGLIDPQYTQFAIQTLKIAAQLSPADPQIPTNIALLYQQNQNYAEAESLFKQAIALKSDYALAYTLLAQMYEEQKDYPKAIEAYQNLFAQFGNDEKAIKTKIEELKTKI